MTDQNPVTSPTRVFKIGSVRIVEDASMAGKSPEEIRSILKPLYPQVENATIREHTEGEATIIEYLARAGRKG